MRFFVLLVSFAIPCYFTNGHYDYKRSKVKATRNGVSVGAIPTLPGAGEVLLPLEQLVLKSFNNLKNVMLSGSSQNGIPILDPLVIPFSIPLTFPNPICGIGTWQLVLSKLTFMGLSNFTVRSLDVEVGKMNFDLFIANMSATCAYNLNYYLTPTSPPVPVCSGTAYGSIVGADFAGSGEIFPTPGNWFNLATITIAFGFQDLDIRIYPNLPFVEPNIEKQIEDAVYDAIQKMKPNISNLTHLTYTKTVSLQLGSLP